MGLVALTVGVWLFLDASGVQVPSFRVFWPLFLAIGGAASLYDFLALSKRPGAAGQAVLGFGLSALFFTLTLGTLPWRPVLDWLPGLPLVIGLALLTNWAVGGMRDNALMVASVILLALGLTGFAARFDVLQRILPSGQVLWAILLVIGGGVLIWRAVGKR